MQRLLDVRLPLLALLPTRTISLSYMEKVHAAGGLPVLDAEFLETDEICRLMAELDKKRVLFALRIPLARKDLLDSLAKKMPIHLEAVIFSYLSRGELGDAPLSDLETKRLLEVRHTGLEKVIEKLGCHGLVLKGFEAAGLVSARTSFILMQAYLASTDLPVFVQGGVGMHTAAGFFAAGASGLVLDSQLWLSRESPLSNNFKKLFSGIEEFDTLSMEGPGESVYRFFARLGTRIVHDLKKMEPAFTLGAGPDTTEGKAFLGRLEENLADLGKDHSNALQSLFFLGQDAVFARHFRERGESVEEQIHALFHNVREQIRSLGKRDPMTRDSAFAREHGILYPIFQGPMANITDNHDFAEKILEAGGLPFFAVGSLPVRLADAMLEKASEKKILCGAGLVGIEAFNPRLGDHLASMKRFKVPYALFAGGSAAQVKNLEASGIMTYLHTPASAMLANAIRGGVNRFILEGTECGGHVGSLTSLVLWELACEKIGNLTDAELFGKSLVFAGGISTSTASHFISGMTAGLDERGLGIGVQVGTAYLFTREIVETGALTACYQQELLGREETMLLGSTVGLGLRTVESPFSLRMREMEQKRLASDMSLTERKEAFEKDNTGSLLASAKGFVPDFSGKGSECRHLDEAEIHEKGNFCTGDSLVFFRERIGVADIHHACFEEKKALRKNLDSLEYLTRRDCEIFDEVAVIGMGCVLPDADSPEAFWKNILEKRVSIAPICEKRLPSIYFSEDRNAEDKTYTRLAAEVTDFTFAPGAFGFDEKTGKRLSRSQQMILTAAAQAAKNAGYATALPGSGKPFPMNTTVILASCLGNEMSQDLHMKYWTPEITEALENLDAFGTLDKTEKKKIRDQIRLRLAGDYRSEPPDTAVLNIEASRISAFLGVEGPNYLVDAACATSFAALDCAIQELLSGKADTVVTGGLNTNLAPETFVGFAKMGALSAEGSWPFDERADGFVLGEGALVFILKRMRDALADGDSILGVIRGIGASSDGKGKAIAAPGVRGQVLAMERCFSSMKRPASPESIDFIEAHGTSTRMGDQTELQSLCTFYGKTERLGVSSVKSQVGHLLGGAGAAGLMKTLLALNAGILPPNGGFEKLSSAHNLSNSGPFILAEKEEWKTPGNRPRMAAVSSYGFGGINYHCVLEAYGENYEPLPRDVFPDLSFDPNEKRIVVAGIGQVLPGMKDGEAFWDAMVSGKTILAEDPEPGFNAKAYASFTEPEYILPRMKTGRCHDFRLDPIRYRIPPKSSVFVDKSQQMALAAADRALTASGVSSELADFGNRVGVILGSIGSRRNVETVLRIRLDFLKQCIEETEGLSPEKRSKVAEALVALLREKLPPTTEDTTPGLLTNIVTGRIANTLNCNGQNFIVDAACASSAFALRSAMMHLASGRCDFVVSGGVDASFYPAALLVFKRLGLLSRDRTRFWDRGESQGVNFSEGAAVHVLTTYARAREKGLPILGEISAISMASRARESVFALSDELLAEEIRGACKEAGCLPRDLDHIDPFGFGHRIPDAIEKDAVEKAMRGARGISFGNMKGELGYFKGANPAMILARFLMMQQKRTRLPHHSYLPETSLVSPDSPLVLPEKAGDLALRRRPLFGTNLHGFGGNHGHMLVSALPPFLDEKALAGEADLVPDMGPHGDLCVLLSGQGSQRPGMLKELYALYPEVRELADRAEVLFRGERKKSLLDMIFSGKAETLARTENTQPSVFLVSAAIHHLLSGRGFTPKRYLGHSLGEYTALYAAGVLGFEDAFRLVLTRSSLMQKAAEDYPGAIMAVFKGPEEVSALIGDFGGKGVYLANRNSPGQTVVSGDRDGVGRFGAFLAEKGILFKKLQLSGAFHTPLFGDAAKGLERALQNLSFNVSALPKIISNVTARPYPEDSDAARKLLVSQTTSPVAFMDGIAHLHDLGFRNFCDIGPDNLLAKLVHSQKLKDPVIFCAVDPKRGEGKSIRDLMEKFEEKGWIRMEKKISSHKKFENIQGALQPPLAPENGKTDFAAFLEANRPRVEETLKREFIREQALSRLRDFETFGFYTGPVSIAGVSVGLPGKGGSVFSDNHFKDLFKGKNFIDPLTEEARIAMLELNVTRLHKTPEGNARFVPISSSREVIQLAGQLGYFDLKDEYGIEEKYDITMALATAAGLEALKDAHIPLLPMSGKDRRSLKAWNLALPDEMQQTTGVIFTGIFLGWETLLKEMKSHLEQKFLAHPGKEFTDLYYFLMEKVESVELKEKITNWFFSVKSLWEKKEDYAFDREFLDRVAPLGSTHFARLIQAKGPNIQLSGACASVTQAVGVAEDWIRGGRCERVIIIGSDAVGEQAQSPWVGAGFLSLGAATIEREVERAVKPFDADRNGTILASGATAILVERKDSIEKRGLNGQVEILGTFIGNSAFHTTRLDVEHLAVEMKRFVRSVEARHGLSPESYAGEMIFMSHETYTPARGGSADAEVEALRACFGKEADKILITNTKGLTGHTMGAGIEDAVMVKALQEGKTPPVAHLKKIPENFASLRFSKGEAGNFLYGLHFAAGFGSHFAMLMVKRTEERKTDQNAEYKAWLSEISGLSEPRLSFSHKTLVLERAKSGKIRPAAQTVEKFVQAKENTEETPASARIEKISISPVVSDKMIFEEIRKIVAEQTGYEEEMLGQDLDLEGDLGIDTVKQVEIFGKIMNHFGLSVEEDAPLRELSTLQKITAFVSAKKGTVDGALSLASFSSPAVSSDAILCEVRKIVAEQTGYEEEMLASDLDLEGDLGIDTVKQVEIFGKVMNHFNLSMEEDAPLRELSTLRKLSTFIASAKEAAPGDLPTVTLSSPASSTDSIFSEIRKIVSEQTGYEEEMLGKDLDLEGDLGIDTVKQVEIFGKIMNHFGLSMDEDAPLRELSTLQKIAGFISGKKNEENLSGKPEEVPAVPEKTADKNAADIFRFETGIREDLVKRKGRFTLTGRKVLLALGDEVLGREVKKGIEAAGASSILTAGKKGADFIVNMNNTDEVTARFEEICEKHPDICGLVLLHPMNDDGEDRENLPESLFEIIRILQPCLDRQGAFIAMPASGSLVFPTGEGIREGVRPDPVQAACAGFLKSIAREFPRTRVKLVDFGNEEPDATPVAETFIREILEGDRRVEVGFREGVRYLPTLLEKPFNRERNVLSWKTLLVTGGAGGITFEIMKALVREQPDIRLILVGRSDPDALPLELEGKSRSELMAHFSREMKGAKPLEIKKAVSSVLSLQKLRKNLEEIGRVSDHVRYAPLDATNFEAVREFAGKNPQVNAILHGAGVEESRMLSGKDLASFRRVFSPKITGMRNILRAFENHDLKALFAFSSVTARFGNPGQCDYTAANDMLGKMVLSEQIRRPGLVAKVFSWTAWQGAGMATRDSVQKVLSSRGISFLPLGDGIRFFLDECRNPESCEAVFVGKDRGFDPDGLLPMPGVENAIDHFLDHELERGERSRFSRRLESGRDLFLKDHSLAGVPLFLGATGLETLAEAALQQSGQAYCVEISDFHIPYGIKLLKNRPKDLEIIAENKGDAAIRCRILSSFKRPGEDFSRETLHYEGLVKTADMRSPAHYLRVPDLPGTSLKKNLADLVYRPERLFMDGVFRTIEEVSGFDGKRMTSLVADRRRGAFFAGEAHPDFKTPVILLDAMFQTGGLFNMLTGDTPVLPSRIGNLRILDMPDSDLVYVCITEKKASLEKTDLFDMYLVDGGNRLMLEVRDFEMIRIPADEKFPIGDEVAFFAGSRAS